MPTKDPTVFDSVQGTDYVDHNTGDLQDDYATAQALKSEEFRLSTFTEWPTSIPVRPEELARDGFYYLGNGDRVKCIFCNLILKSWEAGDVVRTEHKKFNPNCAFLLQKNVGNIPLVAAGPSHGSMPKHPDYSRPEVRLETMRSMPSSVEQCPKQLAAAGFFYTGNGDNMRCFQCGGNLKNWEPEDDPWEEHLHWFPNCQHLKMSPKTKESLEMTPFTQECLKLGYDKELVKNAIARKRRSGAGEYEDLNALIDVLEKLRCQQETVSRVTSTMEPGAAAGPPGPSQTSSTSGASSLEDECRQLREQRLCKICMERDCDITFIPCGHLVTCDTCSQRIRDCPICRQRVRGSVRTYLS